MSTMVSRRTAISLMAAASSVASLPAMPASVDAAAGTRLTPSSAERSLKIISPAMLESAVRAAIPPACFEFIHGGGGDEWTLQQNVDRLRATTIYPRRMADVASPNTTISFFSHELSAPLYVCPMGSQDYANTVAEIGTSRGAAQAGILYLLSSASNRSLEEVAHAVPAGSLRFFTIYLNSDPAVNRALAHRARDAGFKALVITADSLGPGASERFLAMGAPQTTIGGYGNYDPARGGSGGPLAIKKDLQPSDIAMLHQESGLPVLVKGVLRPDDAVRLIQAGAAGIVVSNHGGRTLDGGPAAIDALGPIAEAVKGRVPILFDSGVRRGTDVIRALAKGATLVGIGRPVLDALALGGEQGVNDMLGWFKKDLATQMLQIGVGRISDISEDLLHDA